MKTLEELEELKKERNRVKNTRKLCIELDICPICNSNIIREDKEIYDKPKTYLFGLIKDTYWNWNIRKICSKDKSHYEYKEDFDENEFEYY